MIRVAHLFPAFYLGGATRSMVFCAEACCRSTAMRHVAIGLAPAPVPLALEFIRQHGIEAVDAPERSRLLDLVAEADIVQLHYWNAPSLDALLRAELPPMRLAIQMHIGGGHAPHVITPALVDFADLVLNTGPYPHGLPVFAALGEAARREKTRLIYPAAALDPLFTLAPEPHDGITVTYAGTVDFQKMHPDFIRLCAGVDQARVRFLVCGPGARYPELRRQAEALGLAGRIEFRGEVRDIREVLRVTDIFGYPLCRDNYSAGELILQEVAAAGLPAVVLPHGGAGAMVRDGVTGLVARDARDYAAAVARLAGDPDRRARLGQNARDEARRLYGADKTARETLAAYETLLARPKRRRVFGQDPAAQSGARRFVASLGDTAPQFSRSLVPGDAAQARLADEAVAASSAVLVNNGIAAYRDYYPRDPGLQYWSGLVLERQGDGLGAAVAYLRAARGDPGFDRASFGLARVAAALGLGPLAREAWAAVGKALRQDQAGRALAGLADGLSVEGLRQRRDIFHRAGELERAWRDAGAVLAGYPNAGDFEAYYLVGLGWHKAGELERAETIYDQVESDPRAPRELVGWAYFKHGEILKARGESGRADRAFARALECKPDLAKAAIALADPDAPLAVDVGEDFRDGGIVLAVDPLDPGQWRYHFGERRPDVASVRLPEANRPWERAALFRLLGRYLAPQGAVRFYGAGADGPVPTIPDREDLTLTCREPRVFSQS